MPTLTNGCIIACTAKGSFASQTTLTTFHYKVTPATAWGNPDYFDFITALHTENELAGNLTQQYAGVTSEDFFISKWVYQALHPTRYVAVEKVTAHDQGTVAGTGLPPAVATALIMRTDQAGRTQRGVKHMPGVPSDWVEEGMVTGAAQTQYQVLIDYLKLQFTITVGGTDYLLDFVIFHRAAPSASPIVTSGTVGLTSRTEKRRVVGRGI